MINFFRRIRRKLIDEENLKKYFFYGIGETLLVVLGILIALQINNWNSKQIDKIKESAYIEDIVKDLSRDTTIIGSNFLKIIERKKNALRKVKNHLIETPSKFDTLVFLKEVGIAGIFSKRELLLNNSTYTELISTGNFRVISDKELRKKLINYYNLCDIMLLTLKQQRSNYPDFVNSIRAFNPKEPSRIEEADQIFAIKTIQLRNDEFYRLLNQELTFAYNLEDLTERIKNTAIELIGFINKK